MSAGPEVSIIMPVRNEAAALDAALASVCSQATDASIEVIVVDDHSTDSSQSIIERWAARDERAFSCHRYSSATTCLRCAPGSISSQRALTLG